MGVRAKVKPVLLRRAQSEGDMVAAERLILRLEPRSIDLGSTLPLLRMHRLYTALLAVRALKGDYVASVEEVRAVFALVLYPGFGKDQSIGVEEKRGRGLTLSGGWVRPACALASVRKRCTGGCGPAWPLRSLGASRSAGRATGPTRAALEGIGNV